MLFFYFNTRRSTGECGAGNPPPLKLVKIQFLGPLPSLPLVNIYRYSPRLLHTPPPLSSFSAPEVKAFFLLFFRIHEWCNYTYTCTYNKQCCPTCLCHVLIYLDRCVEGVRYLLLQSVLPPILLLQILLRRLLGCVSLLCKK